MKNLGLSVLLLMLLWPAGLAVSVKRVNLVEMTAKADRVFYGKCLSREAKDVHASLPIAEYKFQVKEAIKGVSDGETVVFRQVEGSAPGKPGIPGVPQYRVGQELVLFLKKDSRRGLTSPVGLGQGTFIVKKNGRGAAEVMNLVGNRNLGAGLSAGDESGLTTEQLATLRSGRGIPLSSFASVVNKVVRLHGPDNRNR
ncbi:MAG: hypothetical protein EHM23_25800 [Acidobacteria bacterium]|nr:MAG: hypothetical protein EHM23_25800 [Acidobacteriota bacterium]